MINIWVFYFLVHDQRVLRAVKIKGDLRRKGNMSSSWKSAKISKVESGYRSALLNFTLALLVVSTTTRAAGLQGSPTVL
jgi:hypothetical protein